jgi:cytochrome c5
MSGAKIAALMLGLAALALVLMTRTSGDRGASQRVAAAPARLTAGAGEELAARHCLMCHSAMLITQQAKDSTGWEKTIAQMEKWSAPLEPVEHQTLQSYLTRHYGPRTPR